MLLDFIIFAAPNIICNLWLGRITYAQNHGNFVPRCEKEPFRNVVTKTWKKIYSENGQNL